MKDDRARISSLRKKGFEIESKPCAGYCGVRHNSRILMRMLKSPVMPLNAPVAFSGKRVCEAGVKPLEAQFTPLEVKETGHSGFLQASLAL